MGLGSGAIGDMVDVVAVIASEIVSNMGLVGLAVVAVISHGGFVCDILDVRGLGDCGCYRICLWVTFSKQRET